MSWLWVLSGILLIIVFFAFVSLLGMILDLSSTLKRERAMFADSSEKLLRLIDDLSKDAMGSLTREAQRQAKVYEKLAEEAQKTIDRERYREGQAALQTLIRILENRRQVL